MEKDEFFEKVHTAINQGVNLYQAILNGAFQEYNCISLDCTKLIDPAEDETLPDQVINHFFAYLHKDDVNGFQINKKACLYVFEIVSHTAVQIKDIYKIFCENEDLKYLNKSAMKKNPSTNSIYLYVGKVKSGIGNRMATHFGYANPKIGGLQLRHWAKDIGLKLKVHIIALDEVIDDYINPLELNLTKNMKPLIGKSK